MLACFMQRLVLGTGKAGGGRVCSQDGRQPGHIVAQNSSKKPPVNVGVVHFTCERKRAGSTSVRVASGGRQGHGGGSRAALAKRPGRLWAVVNSIRRAATHLRVAAGGLELRREPAWI